MSTLGNSEPEAREPAVESTHTTQHVSHNQASARAPTCLGARQSGPCLHVSSCEPPSDQPQEACLPPQPERRRCLRRGGSCSRRACATAAQHARPHAREGKGSPRTERRVPHRAGQRAAHLAVRLLQRPRTQEQRAPCLRRTCCLAWGLSSLSFASEGASNGQQVEEAWL